MAVQGRKIDAALVELAGGIYDIQFTDGDVETQDFFDTALIVSLLSDRRANESEALLSHMRRGWIGNEHTPGIEIGSKIWLYEQSRLTRQIINQVADAARNAVQWMVEDDLVVAIRRVTAEFLPPSSPIIGARITVEIERSNSVIENRYFDFWPQTAVPATVSPADPLISAVPVSLGVTKSLDLNGTDEWMAHDAYGSVGIVNQWSIAVWCNTDLDTGTNDHVFDVAAGDTTNRIALVRNASGGDGWTFQVRDSSGTLFKEYKLDEVDTGTWVHFCFTWDGATLKFYKNGANRDGDLTKSTDTTGTMTDTGRAIFLGALSTGAGTLLFDGKIHSLAVWDQVLDAPSVAQIAGAGDADLRFTFGAYTNQGDLKRYYVPGLDEASATAMGEDYAPIAVAAAAPSLGLTQFLDLDGAVERMSNIVTGEAIGIVNDWSIAVWCNADTDAGANDMVFELSPVAGSRFNGIQINRQAAGPGGGWVFSIFNTVATGSKSAWLDEIDVNVWTQLVLTYDGITLKIYKDGVDRTDDATFTVDQTVIQADTGRAVWLASSRTSSFFRRRIFTLGVWGSTLTAAEIAALYDNGWGNADPRGDFGNYVSSANLEHFYAPGLNDTSAATMGEDYGVASLFEKDLTGVNIAPADLTTGIPKPSRDLDTANNVTPADLVADVPS